MVFSTVFHPANSPKTNRSKQLCEWLSVCFLTMMRLVTSFSCPCLIVCGCRGAAAAGGTEQHSERRDHPSETGAASQRGGHVRYVQLQHSRSSLSPGLWAVYVDSIFCIYVAITNVICLRILFICLMCCFMLFYQSSFLLLILCSLWFLIILYMFYWIHYKSWSS